MVPEYTSHNEYSYFLCHNQHIFGLKTWSRYRVTSFAKNYELATFAIREIKIMLLVFSVASHEHQARFQKKITKKDQLPPVLHLQ